MNLMDLLQPQVSAATNSALDTAASRPFSVVLSVSPQTQAWINNALTGSLITGVIAAVVAGLILKRIR